MFHRIRGKVLLRAAGKPKHHGEVSILDPIHIDREMMLGHIGQIVLGKVCRSIVRIGIDPEHTEISRMTWPNPIVCVAPELPYCRGWRTDKTYIPEHAARDQKVAVAKVKSHHFAFKPLALCCLEYDRSHFLFHLLVPRLA